MTTMINAPNSDGPGRRCDANCYNAKSPRCRCICGGQNHGVGPDQAAANTTEFAALMLADYAAGHADLPPLDQVQTYRPAPRRPAQQLLFPTTIQERPPAQTAAATSPLLRSNAPTRPQTPAQQEDSAAQTRQLTAVLFGLHPDPTPFLHQGTPPPAKSVPMPTGHNPPQTTEPPR